MSAWHILHDKKTGRRGTRTPTKLLFRIDRRNDGIQFYVTDLLSIWTDGFWSRKALSEEARMTRCSIDPSEDASQYEVLISKLRDGLAGSNGGSCKMGGGQDTSHGQKRDLEVQAFRLEVQVPLPVPLEPLHWNFNLNREDSGTFASELLLPALKAEAESQRMMDNLKQKLVEKDHAISRLMDKIDQTGMDLSLVFPGFSSARKGLNAQAATKLVPGLAKMDLGAWETQSATENRQAAKSITDAFFNPNTGKILPNLPRRLFVDPHGEDESSTDDDEQGIAERRPKPPNLPILDSTDAFESTQRPMHPQNQDPGHSNRRSMSTSSDDSLVPDVKQRPPKIGNLGRSRKSTTEEHPPTPQAQRKSNASSATASGSDSSSPPPSSKAKSKPKPASKLGALGGKKKRSPAPRLKSSSPATPSSNPSTPSRKLGMLGGRPKSATPQRTPAKDKSPSQRHTQGRSAERDDAQATTPTPSPSPTSSRKAQPALQPSPPPPPPTLTAEQQAQQKREDLKRALNTGEAGAGIKKKKRKF